jgi:hypothetical protein
MLFIVKAAPDVDLYMEWSLVADGPTYVGNRVQMLSYLGRTDPGRLADTPESRLNRADADGTSTRHGPDGVGSWRDSGMVVANRWLSRDKFPEFMRLYHEVSERAAYGLLESLASEEWGHSYEQG